MVTNPNKDTFIVAEALRLPSCCDNTPPIFSVVGVELQFSMTALLYCSMAV